MYFTELHLHNQLQNARTDALSMVMDICTGARNSFCMDAFPVLFCPLFFVLQDLNQSGREQSTFDYWINFYLVC